MSEQLLWARVGEPGRGRVLTHESVARAAVALADADGLEAVTMRRVATALGVGTMSLYRYVSTREELVDLMVDRALGELTLAGVTGDWRAVLTASARIHRELAARHPWLATVGPGVRSALGPQALRWIEEAMSRLDRPGLTIDQVLDMDSTMRAFVVGFVQAELQERAAQRATGLSETQWRQQMAPYLREVLAGGDHPYLERIIRDAEDFPDPDAVFERRLGYVLDGLAAGLGLD